MQRAWSIDWKSIKDNCYISQLSEVGEKIVGAGNILRKKFSRKAEEWDVDRELWKSPTDS